MGGNEGDRPPGATSINEGQAEKARIARRRRRGFRLIKNLGPVDGTPSRPLKWDNIVRNLESPEGREKKKTNRPGRSTEGGLRRVTVGYRDRKRNATPKEAKSEG